MLEKRMINSLLVFCLTLGFVCLAAIYLPDKLAGEENQTSASQPEPLKFKQLLAQNTKPQGKTPSSIDTGGGIYSRFDPELLPTKSVKTADSRKQPVIIPASVKTQTKEHRTSSLSSGKKRKKIEHHFKTPLALEPDVTFWKYIYSKYDSHQEVFHDPQYLNIIYSVLDFRQIDLNENLTEAQRQERKAKVIEDEKDRILALLDRLAKSPDQDLSEKELRIKRLFYKIKDENKFAAAKERGVRSQTGQKDKFEAGLIYSGRYLGEFEAIFNSHGLPQELTRMVFVESMFDPKAHSSAGAKGFWQFMKGTGKKYDLKITSIQDQRADPILATHAAARLLKDNYEILGTWPLAINAYNSGRGRLGQAKKRLGTTDIVNIVRNFKHRSYGFASRNFYMEFLAALEIAQNYEQYFGEIKIDEPLRYDLVIIDRPLMIPELAKMTNTSLETIAELNPSLSTRVIYGESYLPANFELRVPEKKGESFIIYAYEMPVNFPITHTVGEGESLNEIARMYNVTTADILHYNKWLHKRRLRVGQKITIAKRP